MVTKRTCSPAAYRTRELRQAFDESHTNPQIDFELWMRFQKKNICAIMVEKAPEAIRMHLLVQCGEKPDWVKLRQTVHDSCYAVIPGPIAIDVGATKGRRKGKRKGKYELPGDGGKGKKGKKGKQAKNSGKSKGHEHFDGHCLCLVRLFVSLQEGTRSQFQDGHAAFCSVHKKTSCSPASASPQTASTHGAIVHCGLEEDEDGWVFGVEWKAKRVRSSRIILLVQMNFLTTAEMARE